MSRKKIQCKVIIIMITLLLQSCASPSSGSGVNQADIFSKFSREKDFVGMLDTWMSVGFLSRKNEKIIRKNLKSIETAVAEKTNELWLDQTKPPPMESWEELGSLAKNLSLIPDRLEELRNRVNQNTENRIVEYISNYKAKLLSHLPEAIQIDLENASTSSISRTSRTISRFQTNYPVRPLLTAEEETAFIGHVDFFYKHSLDDSSQDEIIDSGLEQKFSDALEKQIEKSGRATLYEIYEAANSVEGYELDPIDYMIVYDQFGKDSAGNPVMKVNITSDFVTVSDSSSDSIQNRAINNFIATPMIIFSTPTVDWKSDKFGGDFSALDGWANKQIENGYDLLGYGDSILPFNVKRNVTLNVFLNDVLTGGWYSYVFFHRGDIKQDFNIRSNVVRRDSRYSPDAEITAEKSRSVTFDLYDIWPKLNAFSKHLIPLDIDDEYENFVFNNPIPSRG